MAHYRLYFLDATDRIRGAVDLECESDSEAINRVEGQRARRGHSHGMELWQQTRQIRTFAGSEAKLGQPYESQHIRR
jgi:hypothetical protein